MCVIPHECLTAPGDELVVGVYGTKGSELVIPTVYASLGFIAKSADPGGDPSTDPTLPMWAALTESLESVEVSPEKVAEAITDYLAEHPLDVSEKQDKITEENKLHYGLISGAPEVVNGTDGKDGADGYTPIKGVDYYTAADKSEMVTAVVAALPRYNGGVSS